MGKMKDLLITIHGGGDEAVEAVDRIGKDWRDQLEQAASEIEQLRKERDGWKVAWENERALHDEILRQAREMASSGG